MFTRSFIAANLSATPTAAITTKIVGTLELLWMWTLRTVRSRYQQSLLGWLWVLAQPLVSIAILSVVFTRFVRVDTGETPYIVFSCLGVIPFLFLSASLTDMTDSVVQNLSLITKASFQTEILPVSAMLARLFDFLVAFGFAIVLLLTVENSTPAETWLFVPVILAVQITLILGVGFFAAALNVFFRDIRSILTLGLQVWFYASPIIYPVETVPERFRDLYMLNPMVGVIQAYRDTLLHHVPPGSYLLSSAVIALVLFISGFLVFKRLATRFADIV